MTIDAREVEEDAGEDPRPTEFTITIVDDKDSVETEVVVDPIAVVFVLARWWR